MSAHLGGVPVTAETPGADGADPDDGGVRCAEWTLAEGVDPVGTAGHHRMVLLVETPPPWPRDVSEIPALADAAGRDPSVRVLAVVPRQEDDTGLLRVVRWLHDGSGSYAGTDHRVPADRVPALLQALLDEPDGVHEGHLGPSPTDLLLCTHGRRDRCCGRSGTLLSAEVFARWDGVRVWRSSHTGGHRFAPTGVTFPDGRAWAHLDVELLDGILARSADWGALRAHHRGSLTLDSWAQAAEGALLEQLGWGWATLPGRRFETSVHPGGRGATVTVGWVDGGTSRAATVEVAVARDVPVVACGLPLAAATKTSPELTVTSVVGPA